MQDFRWMRKYRKHWVHSQLCIIYPLDSTQTREFVGLWKRTLRQDLEGLTIWRSISKGQSITMALTFSVLIHIFFMGCRSLREQIGTLNGMKTRLSLKTPHRRKFLVRQSGSRRRKFHR